MTRSFDLGEPFGERVSRDPTQQAALVVQLVDAMRIGDEATAATLLHDLTAHISDPATRKRLADECRRLSQHPWASTKREPKAPTGPRLPLPRGRTPVR